MDNRSSHIDTVSRERKKDQLRRRMLAPPRPADPYQEGGGEGRRPGTAKKARRRRLLAAGVILVLLGGAGFGYYQYQKYYEFSGYQENWAREVTEGSYVGYEYFGANVLKYTRDGASYYDDQGKAVWTQSYEMKAPIVSIMGDYAAIADQGGNNICIFNKLGMVGTAATVLPISHVAAAGNGVVAVVIEEATASYINFFNRDGAPIDIAIKSAMAGDGYPVDISLSHDGTQLLCSYVYLAGDQMRSRIVFRDFSEVGKKDPARLVGGFDEIFGGTPIAARVRYLGDPYSCVFTGNGLAFFSSRNLASPELIKEEPIEEEIRSICYSEDYVAVIVKTGEAKYPSRLVVFRSNGQQVLSQELDYDYTEADIDGDLVFLYNDKTCRAYNLAGVLKLDGTFDFPVAKIRKGRFPNTLLIAGPQDMKEIKLQ